MDATASRFATHTQPSWPQQPPRAFARTVSLWQGNFSTYVATSSWLFYRSRYASWVCFVIARMFDFCTLSNYGQCIMNSKLSECLKNYWSYYLDSTVNTVSEKKYLHCIFIFFQWNKRKIYCTRIEIYNSQNEFSNMITSNNL